MLWINIIAEIVTYEVPPPTSKPSTPTPAKKQSPSLCNTSEILALLETA